MYVLGVPNAHEQIGSSFLCFYGQWRMTDLGVGGFVAKPCHRSASAAGGYRLFALRIREGQTFASASAHRSACAVLLYFASRA